MLLFGLSRHYGKPDHLSTWSVLLETIFFTGVMAIDYGEGGNFPSTLIFFTENCRPELLNLLLRNHFGDILSKIKFLALIISFV